MTDVVLGVDIGTTSTKVVAFAVDGTQVAESPKHGYPLEEPEEGHAVQDPALVVAAAIDGIRDAAALVREAGGTVRGVSFSSAMHSLVGLDADAGYVTPLITWADTRAAVTAERLKAEHPGLHARTGTPLHPMSPLVKLAWLREHDASTFARATRWAGIKELVVERLTGEWAVDHSVASASGLMDLRTTEYDPEALEVAGVDPSQLSALYPATHVVASGLTAAAAQDTGLDPDTPIVLGAGDGPLANLGVGAVHPGVAACSIGTSGALRLMVEAPIVDEAGRLFCYALTPGRWVVGGAINNGGVVLQWAGDALAPDLDAAGDREAALLALAAEVPAGADGLLMLPYLLSERAPHWSALPLGAYVGLRRSHGRGHLVRAAIEGVCQQLALVLASMRDAGNEVRGIRATGGFATGDLWPQILTDTLGLDVGFPDGHEGSGFGAALLGMEALGLVDTLEVAADLVQIDHTLEPDADAAATYAQLRPIFDDLYDALGPAYTALRALGVTPPGTPSGPR